MISINMYEFVSNAGQCAKPVSALVFRVLHDAAVVINQLKNQKYNKAQRLFEIFWLYLSASQYSLPYPTRISEPAGISSTALIYTFNPIFS